MCNLHIKPIVSLPAAGRRHLDPEAGNLTERRPPSVEARKTIVRLCDEVNSARWTIPARGSSAKSESRCSARPSNPTIGARPILRRRSPSRLSAWRRHAGRESPKGGPSGCPSWVPAPLASSWPHPMRFNASPCSRSSRASSRSLTRVPPFVSVTRYPGPYPLRTGPVECSQGRLPDRCRLPHPSFRSAPCCEQRLPSRVPFQSGLGGNRRELKDLVSCWQRQRWLGQGLRSNPIRASNGCMRRTALASALSRRFERSSATGVASSKACSRPLKLRAT